MDSDCIDKTTVDSNHQVVDQKINKNKEKDISHKDHAFLFGCFGVHPQCLQVFNRGVWVLVVLTTANTVASGTYNGLSGAVQSSLETRFQLSSTQSSWIMTSFDVATIFASLLFTYIGSKPKCYRPRVIAAGLLLSSLACVLYCLPHFISDTYIPVGDVFEEDDLCRNRTGENICSDDTEEDNVNFSSQNFLPVFIIARILLSFGVTPITMLGLTYLDDCVTKQTFSFYSGIFVCGWIGGPALGFVFGGMFLSIFTDFYSEENGSPDIDPDDPRWVGAWWLGFILSAICLFIVSLPMAGFPIDLPGAAEMRKNKKTEAFDSGEENSGSMKVDFTAKDILPYLKYLFTNWTFVFLTLFVTCDIAIMAGFTVFGPKFVEVQYNLTPAQSGILFGILVVPAAFIGSIAGGAIVKKFKMGLIDVLKCSIFLSMIIIIGGAFMLLSCPDQDMAGVNAPYPSSGFHRKVDVHNEVNLTAECNSGCWCENISFNPVCFNDELQFYSACYAGCASKSDDMYYECSCVLNTTDAQVTSGVCSSNSCSNLYIFIVLIFVLMIALFINCAMDMTSMVRSVPPTHRVMAFLLYNFGQKLLGAIPAPVIFGIAFDSSCIVSSDACSDQGACFYYDKQKLGQAIFFTCMCYKVLSVIFVTLAWKLYKPPKLIEMTIDIANGDIVTSPTLKHSNLKVENKTFDNKTNHSKMSNDNTLITKL